jgi:hypothetical protein
MRFSFFSRLSDRSICGPNPSLKGQRNPCGHEHNNGGTRSDRSGAYGSAHNGPVPRTRERGTSRVRERRFFYPWLRNTSPNGAALDRISIHSVPRDKYSKFIFLVPSIDRPIARHQGFGSRPASIPFWTGTLGGNACGIWLEHDGNGQQGNPASRFGPGRVLCVAPGDQKPGGWSRFGRFGGSVRWAVGEFSTIRSATNGCKGSRWACL